MQDSSVRPRLAFSTLLSLWKPDFAEGIVNAVEAVKGEVKPKYFRLELPPTSTEGEVYTADFLYEICAAAFGRKLEKVLPGRKRIALANAKWIGFHLKIGAGISFNEIRALIELYTSHVLRDNGRG